MSANGQRTRANPVRGTNGNIFHRIEPALDSVRIVSSFSPSRSYCRLLLSNLVPVLIFVAGSFFFDQRGRSRFLLPGQPLASQKANSSLSLSLPPGYFHNDTLSNVNYCRRNELEGSLARCGRILARPNSVSSTSSLVSFFSSAAPRRLLVVECQRLSILLSLSRKSYGISLADLCITAPLHGADLVKGDLFFVLTPSCALLARLAAFFTHPWRIHAMRRCTDHWK